MQAAVGVAQLGKAGKFVEKKREIAALYSSLLDGVEGIGLAPEMSWAKNVYWMYAILIKDRFGIDRDELIKGLELRGIETRPLFYPLHVMPPHKTDESLAVAEELSRRGINLPSSVNLTAEQVKYIAGAIREVGS